MQDRERIIDAGTAAGDKENERLKTEVAVLQSRISGKKKKKQTKEKGKETIQPQSSNESNRVPQDSGSGASGMDVGHQQTDIHESCRSENAELYRDLEAAESRILAIELEYCQQCEESCSIINMLMEKFNILIRKLKRKCVALQSANESFEGRVRVLKSEISVMRRERQQQARTLKKYTNQNATLQSINGRLNDHSNELEGERQRQARTIKNRETEITVFRSFNKGLNKYVEDLKLKAEDMEKKNSEQAKIITDFREKEKDLQLTISNLGDYSEGSKQKIVHMREEQARTLGYRENEDRGLRVEIKRLTGQLKAQEAKLEVLESTILSQSTANDQDDSGSLMGMVGFKRKRR